MPYFVITGFRIVTTDQECSFEIEAESEAAALQQVEDGECEDDIEWQDDAREVVKSEPTFTAKEFKPVGG